MPAPTDTPTPTPEPDPYELMLELINEERIKAGLSAVVVGDNRAAQIHAENSLANCISSHWSADGLNPDMRYSLAGGYQSNRENMFGQDYCRLPGQGYSAIASIGQKVRDAMWWWTESPGHRRTILVSRHRKVNIGLAWDTYNFVAVQQFERDNVEYTMLPAIEGRQFSMEGRVKNGADLAHGDHIRVTILYSPPPHSLTQGQIAQVYGNCPPRKVALLSYKSSGEQESSWETCPTPYDFPPESPAPSQCVGRASDVGRGSFEVGGSGEGARHCPQDKDVEVAVGRRQVRHQRGHRRCAGIRAGRLHGDLVWRVG